MSTAPAPNAAAPPGMCPGIATLGGGGGAGGSGGGGNGEGGGNGGGGNGDGKGGNGDGKGAGGCGPGSGSGCPNPAHGRGGGTHAGDPIDPLTGRVATIPQTDMPLVGPLVLALQRAYSSFAVTQDVGLGWGWKHTLAWAIVERRRGIEIAPPFGVPVRVDIPDEGAVSPIRGVGLLRRSGGKYVLTEERSGLFFQFEGSGVAGRYRLTTVFDTPGNAVVLGYDDGGRLAQITDSAGRTVFVRREPGGRIERFEMVTAKGRAVAYRRYDYDGDGQLVAAVDAEGRRVAYAYDFAHRLTEERFASGRVVHFRYDRDGRCVESWVDLGGAVDPALADDVPDVLADGITKARGMLHVRLDYGPKTTTVYDSRQTKRLDRNDHGLIDLAAGPWVEALGYDESGHVTAYCDPEDRVTRYERDAAGRLLGVTDSAGHRSAFRYDDQGRLVEAVDELGAALRYSYDPTGRLRETWDQIGTLLRCVHDARGLRTRAEMPNGAVTEWQYDGEGNLVTLVEPHGKPRRFEVDDAGLVRAFTDEEGHRTVFGHDTTNVLRSVTLPNGGVSRVELDPEGRIAAITSPDGATWRLSWGGYHCVHALTKPTGEELGFRYDREGNLVRIVNERGEEHRIDRDAGGRVVGDRFFDGRDYRYRLDASGRLSRHENGAGERTDIERDPCGRVARRTHGDGTAETFAYDPVGRLLESDNGAVKCQWVYDARGNVVREVRTQGRRPVTVEHAYDLANQRVATRTSFGLGVRFQRDLMGRIVGVELPGGGRIERTFDALGREIVRSLPGGGQVVCRYDGVGAMVERRVVGSGEGVGAGAGGGREPAWTGPLPQGTTFAEGFTCSPGGEMIEHWDSTGDRLRFDHDAEGRVLRRWALSAGGRSGAPTAVPFAVASVPVIEEAYQYEGTGRLFEAPGPKREYGPGGVLRSRGGERFFQDGEGRRLEKVRRVQADVDGAGGREAFTGGEVTTRYEWNGRGLLRAVVLPDGVRVDHVYDTQGRRATKRVTRPDGSRTETRYTWSGDDMIHEITWSLPKGKSPAPLRACAFVYDDDGAPLAHRETVWGESGPADRPWVHYALGPGDMPELLIGGDGAILARMRATVWGLVATDPQARARTPLRFPGQYADDETGLHYNRYRFYDPEVGLYISPDPLGLQGGLGAYEYARGRPLRIVDPEGLAPTTCVVVGSAGTTTATSNQPADIHPVVGGAMPKDADGKFPSYTPPTPKKNGAPAKGPPSPGRDPETCAEPGAISDHIRRWEAQNGGPLDPADKPRVAACLGSISSITSTQDGTNGEPETRAPCPNCSQMLAQMNSTYGHPKPGVITPGASSRGGKDSINFTQPHPEWPGSPYKPHHGYPNR